MTYVDWTVVILGLAVGAVASAAYFAGLGFGMRAVLRARQPIRILMFSAVLRIAVLLGVGWAVLSQAGLWAFLGYGMAFILVRTITIAFVKPGPTVRDQP